MARTEADVLDALVVGAGQAGLAAGWHLRRHGLRFAILEASDRPAGAWRGYYDSLELFSPAAYSSLPGLPFPGAADHYPLRDEVVAYLERYARHFDLPVVTRTRVSAVRREDGGFAVEAGADRTFRARTLIAASGAFGTPNLPSLAGLERFGGRILHSAVYSAPDEFAGQRVIVVGGANSAVQIAYELAAVTEVTLASRRPIRFFPQRLLGRDFHFWMKVTGLDRTRWLDDQSTPVLDDGTYRKAIAAGRPPRKAMFREVVEDGVIWADGARERVDVLLFATGFRPHAPYLHPLGAIDAGGELRQRAGIARNVPGLFFVGFPKQRNFASATLRGVGPDAAYVMRRLLLLLHLRSQR